MTNRVSAKNKKLYDQVLESYCDVCFTYFRKAQPKKINEGLEILICTKCHCKTHKCCYDLEPKQTIINDRIREFLCQKCAEPQSKSKNCFICHHSDGALIMTENKELVHIFCALYHNQIDILSYTPRVKAQRSISYQATDKLCDICKLPNAFEACCEFEICKKNAHPYCARKLYLQEQLKNQEPKCWNHHLNCGPSNVFDLKNQILPFYVLKESIQQEFQQVESNAPFQIPNKQNLIKKIYDEYAEEAKLEKKQSKTIKRGGFSFISCPEHQYTPHCICQGTGQGGEMIQCETCFTWYHMDCIKYKQNPNEQIFNCMFCKSFYELKKKIIDEVIGGKNENFEIKCEMPTKISFMDLMWIMRCIDSRIAKGNSKMYKELSKYPLRTSKMDKLIKIQNKKTMEALCQEFFHQYFFNDQQFKFFKPQCVLGLDSSNKPIKLEQNINKNKELRQFIRILSDFCRKQGIVSEFKSIQKELDFKEEAVSDSYEKIIELSKSQQKYQEVAILKIKAQAYSFLQIVKKVNSGSIITINQLQQSVRKASLIENVPEYLTQPLTEKYQKVKSILNSLKLLIQTDPYNLLEIKQTANKLTLDYKIQPPVFYDLYLEERNFTNTLYFYHLKMTERKIQAELSLNQKLSELANATSSQIFICNQELAKNLNSFLQLRQKANNPQYAFQQLRIIISNLQKKTIKQTLTNIQPNSPFKKQRLDYLFGKFIEYSIQDNHINFLFKKYQQICKSLAEYVQKSLENITSVNTLRMINDACVDLMNEIQKFPLKVQQQTKNSKNVSWLQLVRNRKEDIGQLLTLAQEAQFQKNPLSINKLMDSLPKQNPLVKNYKQLKKQHQQIYLQFVNLLAICSEKIDYLKSDGLKKQRKEQIQINDKKPDLKRFNQVLQQLNHSRVDFCKQIKDLTTIVNKSLDISYAVQKFCKAKETFENVNNPEELANARKQIDELRKKILLNSELALTKELTQLYHCEIRNRIRSNLLAGNYDLEKNNKLLKFAQEEAIGTTPSFYKLKEKFETKNQKSKQISLIKNIETRLKEQASKQTDPLYKNLYAARKQLKVPDVEQQMPKISYIEELKQKNREIKAKITKVLSTGLSLQTKVSLDEAKSLLLEALKNPFNLGNLQQFYIDIERCHSFYTNWKRSHNLGRNTLYNDEKLREYQRLKFKVEELQTATKEIYKLKNSLKILETIENVQDDNIQETLAQNLYQNLSLIEQNLETIEENQLAGQDTEMVMLAKRKYLKIWTYYLRRLQRTHSTIQEHNQNKKDKEVVIVNVKKIKKLLYDSYFVLQTELKSTINMINSQQTINELRDNIIFLQQFLMQIKFNYLEGQYDKRTNIVDFWIDLQDFVYELKAGGSLDDLFFVYKPFDDLNKFKYKNLTARNTDLIFTAKSSHKQQTAKRPRPQDFQQSKQQRPLIKKSSLQVVKNQESSDSEQKQNPNVVTPSSRKKVKEILSKNILKNPELKKEGTWQNQVKMIQNQIFGEYHDDVVKYFETSEKFQKLFIKLQSCHQISKKLIKKEFQFKFIKLLVENLNTIGDIQGMMVSKLKEEKNAQKLNLQTEALQGLGASKIEQQQSNNVLDMLAKGNIDQQQKKDLVNEMRRIKEGKQKKKKKSKHKNRSRSRSASPEAKFSQQDQEENLPSYIQKQYAQEGSKSVFQNKPDFQSMPLFSRVEQPLMFDPEINEQEIEDMQKKYPRGSSLKLKSANLQFFLKKRGKMETKVNLYTLQDYKKVVSQLVDPGFTSLNIRKEKSDKQILDYLNKPSKKKYKFLICWIEAENSSSNQNLVELSEEANERHKIYGWQNQHIKIHVMSIKQFVQLTRFSTTIPNKITNKQSVQMFDTQRLICVIQYPAEKMYELKENFKNFTDIQRVEQTYQVSIPLPSYDTYEPIQGQSQPFYPTMGDVQNPNLPSIKPLPFDEGFTKQSNPVEFEGWGQSYIDPQPPALARTQSNPYDQIRGRLGFGRFSPINTDEEDNLPPSKESLPDLADSLLKSFDKKQKFEIEPIDPMSYKSQRSFTQQPFDQQSSYSMKYNRPQYQFNQPKFYNDLARNNPMNQGGMNPMRGYNNSMGGFNQHHNRGFNQQGGQNFNQNRYQNQGGQFRQNYNNPYNRDRNTPYNQRQNRNPMFNPMNPININPMQNNPGNFGSQNQFNQPQYPTNPRYPTYQGPNNNQGGYQQ